MPEISADGRTWTIRIKPGIHFADDPAFKGKKRELTAHDYVYRVEAPARPARALAVPVVPRRQARRRRRGAREGEAGRQARLRRRDRGLRALDRYTLQLKLVEPDYVLLGYMTHAAMAAVAREVIEAYGDASGWVMANPVGTGPFRLKEWRRGQKIVLEANPDFREEHFPTRRRAPATPR